MKRIKEAFKHVAFKDFWALAIFLFLLLPSFVFRLINKVKKRELWLVVEDGEARDNGYYFYKYMRENYPDIFCFYAVRKNSAGYEKIVNLGNVIEYGGLRHWLYYMSANLNISSQKSGNPCPMFWYFMHVVLGLYRNRVFLQHGITKDDADWLYYDKTKFKYFVCGAKREYDFINDKFGYPEGCLLFTGFPRWDALEDISMKQKEKSILIMPTWRNWLGGEKNKLFETRNFDNTKFFRCWNALLNDVDFIKFIEKNNIKVYFYPHINMQIFLDDFKSESKNIEIVSSDEDVQEYLNKCSLMITDYSSVAFDFAYLGKPVLYYQFDLEEYRKKQYSEGYFDYKKDGFGPVLFDKKELMSEIKHYHDTDFKREDRYAEITKEFFLLQDKKNSERVRCSIKNIHNNSEKIKIMFVVNKMNYGGIETFLMNILRKISNEDKYEITFLTFQKEKFDYEEEIIKRNCEILRIQPTRNPLKRYIDLHKVIKKKLPNVIHGNIAFENALVMRAAKKNNVRVRISHSHTTCPDKFGRKLYHKIMADVMCRNATDLIACSKEAGQNLFRGHNNFIIVQNGINLDKFVFDMNIREKYRKKFGFSNDDIVIGHVGRLVDVKNHVYMLQILKRLDNKYKMVFVGDGELKKDLLDMADKLTVNDRVLFLGSRNDTCDLYNMFDIFLFPSIYEGLGMVLVEAQVNGLPIIASSSIPVEAEMNDNFTFLDIKEDPENWVKEIMKINIARSDPSDKLQKYSIDEVVHKIKKIYEA